MVDAVISCALTVVLLTDLVDRSSPWWQLLLGAALTSTVAWRRWAPAPAVALGLVAATLVRDPSQLAQSVVFPLVVVLDYYTLGRRTRGLPRLVTAWVLVVAALPSIWLTPGDSQLVDLASVWLFFFVMPFLAGRVMASRDQVNAELAREAQRLERDVAEQARRAIASERTRIARDLHDVVAHNVSVMAIQVVAARRVAPTDAAAASSALRAVAASGREALVEMRRMVGVLHRSEMELDAAGAPGLGQLGVLVERTRMAGVDVALQIRGRQCELAAGRDVVAFRVVQEALTNVIKHAPSAQARVCVRYDRETVELVITNDTSPPLPAGGRGGGANRSRSAARNESGRGLIGMRERIALYGGSLSARPLVGGGFEVVARLPAALGDAT